VYTYTHAHMQTEKDTEPHGGNKTRNEKPARNANQHEKKAYIIHKQIRIQKNNGWTEIIYKEERQHDTNKAKSEKENCHN
jgi:hypothetical protein